MECIGEKTTNGNILSSSDPLWQSALRRINAAQDNQKPYYFFVKRLLDIILSLAFIILQLPVILIIICLIKMDSPGPVLIRQRRIGRNRRRRSLSNGFIDRRKRDLLGQPFVMYKFRSMRCNSKLYDVKPTSVDDVRITRVGRFLRRSCLDELPQLINVLLGDMALVGPRPELEFIVRQYDPYQQLRLEAKPGITGLWQLLGSRSKHIHEDVHLDLAYIQNQSLRTDFSILLKTFKFAIFLRNL